MKQVKIKKLILHNFKGIKDFETVFNGTTKIFGDNATGKTTLVDAFTWLLFGKDSTGRKDFSIKTFDANNQPIHKLDHEVVCEFDVDGEDMILKRVYREKWVTRRGSSEPELQGHETLFYWNDVPMQAGEFQKKVDQVISEDTFKMLTSPFYFNTLKWQDRRSILTTIAGDVSDQDIASGNLEFSALIENMGNKTLDEFKKELAAKKKKLKDELKQIPARIDEVTRNTPEAKDWAWIEDEIKTVEKNIAIIDEQLQDSSKIFDDFYKKKQERQQKIHVIKSKISDIEHEGRLKFNNQVKEKNESIENAKSEIQRINRKIETGAKEIKDLQERIKTYQDEQNRLRQEWGKVNEEEFPGFGDEGNFKCPTCQQDLPTETIESKKAEIKVNFNAEKERKLADISAQGVGYKIKIENTQKDIGQLQSVDYESQIKAHEAVIKEWQEKHLESVQALISGNVDYERLKKELEEFEKEPVEEEAPKVDNSGLKEKKTALNSTLDGLKKNLNSKSQIETADKRKKQLLDEERKYSQQLAELEQSEFTIQEFTKAKVDLLEAKINSLFEGVRFRMFDTQLNGGLIECCDTIIDGVPWLDANNAAKINAGIEIINVLSKHYEQVAPIWIDNAESITKITDSEAQKIELYVSEAHKELEVA
jgi:DNA repair exonuclease SbcCD ATPase subunit